MTGTNRRVELRGITWHHTRGLQPMVATARRYSELNPGVRITWESRSLQGFADFSVSQLAAEYDLIVLDHPWMGTVHEDNTLLALDDHLDRALLADQETNSVGRSYESYTYGGHLYGLPTDAAAPVAAFRPDLLAKHRIVIPRSWDALMELAKEGWVGLAGIPLDTLMSFYMLCSTMEAGPFVDQEWVVSDDIAVEALELISSLTRACGDRVLEWDPIALYEEMASTDTVAYSPFAYGYTNYSRVGYRAMPLVFNDTVALGGHGKLVTTLGGAGLSISAASMHIDVASDYAMYVADAAVQRTIYTSAGGQPGHRAAWLDDEANRLTSDFFENTLAAHDRAFLRPRFPGYVDFQDAASGVVHQFVVDGGDSLAVAHTLRNLAAKALHEGALS